MIIALNDENPALSQRRLRIQGVNVYQHNMEAYTLSQEDLHGPALVVRGDGSSGPKVGQFLLSSNKHVLLVQATEDALSCYEGMTVVPPGTLVDFRYNFEEGEKTPEVLAYVYVLEVGLPKA